MSIGKDSIVILVCTLLIYLGGSSNLYASEYKIKPKVKEEKAKVIVEPFGNVKWESDPKDVLNYICQIDSVEKVGFIQGRATISDSLDYNTKYLDKNEICGNSNFNIFEQAYKIEYLTTPKYEFVEEYQRKEAYNYFKYNYLNKKFIKKINNKNYIFDSFPISIIAKPININNINFTLTYAFTSKPDVSAGKYFEKRIPHSFNFEGDTYFGFNYLDEVFLIAENGQREALRLYSPEIVKLLEKKYNLKESNSSDKLNFRGSNIMNSLHFQYNSFGLTFIDYRAPDDLETLYKGKFDELLKTLINKPNVDMTNLL